MRILMFLASTGLGGAEKMVVNLCNELRSKHQVAVLAFNASKWLAHLHKDVEILYLGDKTSRFNLFLYFNLIKQIRQFSPDIINSHSAKAAGLIKRVERFFSVPHIATKHNSRKGNVFNHVKHVVAVSGRVADSINRDAKIIYNGIEADKKLKNRAPRQLSDVEFTILAIGRLDVIKGFDRLIKAMVNMSSNVFLKIIGEGNERDRLEYLIESLQLSERVELLGFREDIPEIMSNSHAVVIASHTEGFSLVMVESIFYAKLLLSTDVGGAAEILSPEFIIDGDNIQNKLQEAIDNYHEFCKLFESHVKIRAEEFSVKNMAQQYERFYLGVLKKVGN